MGCGIGRITRFFAEIFAEACGVDISEEMINQAKGLNEDRPNLHFDVGNGFDLRIYEDNYFDFAFCYVVFQHISNRKVIRSYIREIDRVLKPDGLFQLQFYTREWFRAFGFVPIHRLIYNWLVERGLLELYCRFRRRADAQPSIGLSMNSRKLNEMLRDTSLQVIEITIEITSEGKPNCMWCKGRKRH